MNDQLALGVAWRELARRARRRERGNVLGDALAGVEAGLSEDVAVLEDLMARVGVRRSGVKPALAVAAERLGRLKANGRLVRASPLSRFVELDALAMGIEGRRILWANLRDLAGLGERLPDVDFDALVARAEAQRAEIEPFRRAAGRRVLPPDARP